MFARAVSMKVKPDCEVELTRIFKQEVIPLFLQETDFLGLVTFISPDATEALSFSFWGQEETAATSCPAEVRALTALAGVVRGIPSVQVYKVTNSTMRTMEKMLAQGKGISSLRHGLSRCRPHGARRAAVSRLSCV